MALEQLGFEFDLGLPATPKKEEVKPAPKKAAVKKPEPIEEVRQVVEEPAGMEDDYPPLPTKSTRGRKSLKNLELSSQYIRVPEDEELFKKHYYTITEVAQMFNVNPSLLRFWEAEFPVQLRLRKNGKGDRFFTPQNIKTVEKIWFLLRERKLTIEGARDYFKKNKKVDEKISMIQSLQKLKTFLLEMKASL